MSTSDMRVGDAERRDVTDQLSEHFAAGRLNHSEFTERTADALGARTRGELEIVLDDLPPLLSSSTPEPSMARSPEPVDPRTSPRAQWRRSKLYTWAAFAVFFTLLWVLTGAGYFWPVWPILGWGVAVVASGIQVYSQPNTAQARPEPPRPLDR